MDTALLRHVPLFVSLPPAELADMASSLRETRYPAGAVLFYEGDYGDRFYIVLDGYIAIVKAMGSADERLLGRRGAGEFRAYECNEFLHLPFQEKRIARCSAPIKKAPAA